MGRQSTYISFYEEVEITSNPVQTLSLLALITPFWFLLWKAILMSFREKHRQSFSRSFGIRWVLWKSLGAMDQKLDNSQTSCQLLNLCSSFLQIEPTFNTFTPSLKEQQFYQISQIDNTSFNQDWPPPQRFSIKVFKLSLILIVSLYIFAWSLLSEYIFCDICYHWILWHWIEFFDIELFSLTLYSSYRNIPFHLPLIALALGPQIRFY